MKNATRVSVLVLVLISMFFGSCGQHDDPQPKTPVEKATEGEIIPPLPPEGGGT